MSSDAVDDQLIKRIKDEIALITGDSLPPEFIGYGPSFNRQRLRRMVHAIMLAEFGRDYVIGNPTLDVLLVFAQFHVACIMRAANIAAQTAGRKTVEAEDFTLATKLLEEKEHQMMLKRAYEKWGRTDRMRTPHIDSRTVQRYGYGW
ncbi:hypothetical protein A1O7_01503 [Cladophialophora yegresii CBS 114405]|uniref:Transcription factor CBF/NF-Y/archaeal histone domain-containing protein n=1 Tax=Cladophialophora yegresii CBS 114405 TaxID=1182544 RepID=W9WB40_9EURO|nr:uncharacterized protein A1O7_01503 [Cladophialophora yegresii CBS 114405]EXJ65163.1 hypothetical protein A1O7_01503 [Cladophialophora yegresii CBS 114405]